MNSAWTVLNSTWTVLNSAWTVNPCEITVHAQKKRRRKRRREETRNPNGTIFLFTLPLFLVVIGSRMIFYYFILNYKELTSKNCENILLIYNLLWKCWKNIVNSYIFIYIIFILVVVASRMTFYCFILNYKQLTSQKLWKYYINLLC